MNNVVSKDNAADKPSTAQQANQSAIEQLTLNIRLAGQYYDAETGLHYNIHRYYDPQHPSGTGRYISPDPIGAPDGPERIARMVLYFNDEADRVENDTVMQVDIIGFSRGAAQARHFANLITAATTNGTYRYAAHDPRNGRQLSDPLTPGRPVWRCQRVNFRFLGLWDTVLATNRSGTAYQLGIPAQFVHVAHAVALNEYRSAPAGVDAFATALPNARLWDETRVKIDGNLHYGGFPLQSIGQSSSAVGRTRIERGFIGAHADIGGGYRDNGTLSSVALAWMVGQAQGAGVAMNVGGEIVNSGNPIIHDQSNAIRFGNPRSASPTFTVDGRIYGTNQYRVEDRQIVGGLGDGTQRGQTFGAAEAGGNRGMTNIDTHQFIAYDPRNHTADTRLSQDIPELQNRANQSNRTGTVDMQAYISWLRSNGYTLAGTGQF